MENTQYRTVFGATGKIGKALLGYLSRAEVPTIAVTRDLSRAESLPFVKWMAADMSRPETLAATMENSTAVFLVSGMGTGFVEEQHNVIKAAKAAGVNHFVKLSSAAAGKSSPQHIAASAIGKSHKEVETLLTSSGLNWTILQPTGFMQNWLGEFSKRVKEERGIYEAIGDGRRAYIDLRDIAETAFTVLMNPAEHAGKTYILTGDEALNYRQLADIIGEVIGDKVTYVPLTLEEARERMEKKGMPQWAIQTLMVYTEIQRNGDAAYISPDVSRLLQKPARTATGFIKDYMEWFK
ncbi:SDR family oxidoreductase [Chitinophaga polysaccharea]|uniref:SDR family oxidoreductase n=1 Tax=Chitinophaga polysaccharea TaxID=1293035 RepID=UPI00163C735F|nr:SDR family oxidoreductase [Chitinophaga polysaccharea]